MWNRSLVTVRHHVFMSYVLLHIVFHCSACDLINMAAILVEVFSPFFPLTFFFLNERKVWINIVFRWKLKYIVLIQSQQSFLSPPLDTPGKGTQHHCPVCYHAGSAKNTKPAEVIRRLTRIRGLYIWEQKPVNDVEKRTAVFTSVSLSRAKSLTILP